MSRPDRKASATVRTRLDNGMVVLARRNRAARSIAVRMAFEAGSAFDPPGRAGLAALLAQLLDRGAGDQTGDEIAERFDALGVAFLAQARRDSLDLEARFLPEHLAEVLARLRLIASAPAFPETEVRREREQMLTVLAERDQDTAEVAELALSAALYPAGHPYHSPALGTPDSVGAIGRDDLVTHHRRRIGPSGAVLTLAGDFDPVVLIEGAAAAFGSWPAGGPGETRAAIPEPPLPSGARTIVKVLDGKSQSDIALGILPGVRRLSPDLQPALVMNQILGEFSMGGRLGDAVREKGGLAYYARSHFAAGLGHGPLVVRAGVAPGSVSRAVVLIRRTLDLMRRRGPTTAEMRDAGQAMAASLPRRLETNPGIVAFLAECEFQRLGPDYPDRLPDLIRAVTREQVNEAAARYLDPARQVLVLAGPPAKETPR